MALSTSCVTMHQGVKLSHQLMCLLMFVHLMFLHPTFVHLMFLHPTFVHLMFLHHTFVHLTCLL